MVTPVSTLEEVVERLKPMAADIRDLGVERLALFGSVSRGRPRPDSDADVLVGFTAGRKTYGRFLALAELLEDNTGAARRARHRGVAIAHLGPEDLG